MNTTPDKKLTPMGELIAWIEIQYEKGIVPTSYNIHDKATSLLEAEREYASQQAPAMYTREQVEKAVEFGFRQCKLQGYISPSQEQQFIQSLK